MPVRAARRLRAVAKRFHLFSQLTAPLDPVLFLLSLSLDHVEGGAIDETLVLQTLRESRELDIELTELGAQLCALLREIEKSAQRNDSFTPVGEKGVRSR